MRHVRNARTGRASTAPPSGRTLLNANTDFTYEGYYRMGQYWGNNAFDIWSDGLTHRYVDGQLRLINNSFQGNGIYPDKYCLKEWTLPSTFGDWMTPVAIHGATWIDWDDNICHKSLWYEEETERMWSGSGFDYPQGVITINGTPVLYTRKLPATSGTYPAKNNCTDHSGFFGFQNIGQRALWGKVQRVPDSARSAYGFHKYMSLSGGYTSIAGQGLNPSLGPMFVSFPELHGSYTPRLSYIDEWNVPASDYQICADHRLGASSNTDWYDVGYANRTYDRGVRLTPIENYLNGGDPRQNPQTRPTDPPVLTAEWLSQPTLASVPGDPDGWNRWSWDSYNDCGNWIDNSAGTRTKHGIVMVLSVQTGKAWYAGSAGYSDGTGLEIHVFHPADLAACKNGSLAPWSVRPRTIKIITNEIGLENNPASPVAATFDHATNKLYICVYQMKQGGLDFTNVYQYSVAV
jgi:hypothetical protein